MARGASVKGAVRLEFLEYDTALGPSGGTSQVAQVFEKLLNMVSGTGDGQVDRPYFASLSATTTPATVDLSGSLASLLNGSNTVVFVDLQLLIVENTSTSGNLLIGGGSTPVGLTNGTTDYGIVLPPGGWAIVHFGTAGLAVGAGSTDLLRYASSAGTVTGKLWAAGRSA